MPFRDCIDAALAKGEIKPDYADKAREIYDDHLTGFENSMPRAEAMAEAARSAFRFLEDEAAERRRQAFLGLAARKDIMERLDTYKSYWTGKNDPYKGVSGLFDRLLPGRNGFAVEQQRVYWRNAAYAKMSEAFKAFRPDWLLRRPNIALATNMVKELFGRDTGDALAKTLAKGFTEGAEYLRSNFNRFGGHIGLMENWGLPQAHDWKTIASAGFDAWRDFIAPLLDLSRMNAGRSIAITPEKLPGILKSIYENGITEGWSDREASSAAGRARANTRADSRFLIFKDAEGWLSYQQRFGEPDPVNGMLRHLDGLARDISLMQVLGPNPASTMRWLGQELDRRRSLSGGAVNKDRVTGAMHHLETMYDMTTGKAFAPVNQRMADLGADIGNLLTSAQLGAAVVTAVPSDMGFQILTRKLNGMPAMKLFASLLRQFNPADATHRDAAVRIGAGAEHFMRALTGQERYIGELRGHAATRFLADRVLGLSGLSAWTEGGRSSFFADVLGTVADRAGKEWETLDPAYRASLERYRIGREEWDAIRGTTPYDVNGLKYIRPEDVANNKALDPSQAMDLAQRLADHAGSEQEFAVPSSSLAGAAHARGKNPPGAIHSLVADSFLKYRTFGYTLLMTHGRRLVASGTWQKRGAYFGALTLTSIFAGAIALQMKEIIAGRDPRDMTKWQFWSAALAQGGGLGIIGDFVYAGLQGASRTGGGFGETVSGPAAGAIGDTARALLGAPMTPQQGNVAGRFGSNMVDWLKRYMPGGSIWYLRAVLERYVWDAIQEDIDPNWKQRIKSTESWYRKNYGNDFWWKRGDQPGFDGSSTRAPNLSNALGGQQ